MPANSLVRWRRPMTRPLMHIASVLSLLLCLAAVALWVRSYFANDWIGRVHYSAGIDSEDHHLWLEANCGVLRLTGGGDPAEHFSAVRWERRRFPVDRGRSDFGTDEPRFFRAIGITWEMPRRLITGETSWSVRIRIALPASVFALLAILCARPWPRGRKHYEPMTCASCGYDLRATPGRCPECGTTPTIEAPRPLAYP
jgi:hypothetical protein